MFFLTNKKRTFKKSHVNLNVNSTCKHYNVHMVNMIKFFQKDNWRFFNCSYLLSHANACVVFPSSKLQIVWLKKIIIILIQYNYNLQANVMFLPTARFTDQKPQQSIIADSSGIISCSAEGTPTPQIVWKRQGEKPLEKGRFAQLSSGSLRVNRVLPQDKGIYSCLSIQSKGSNRVTKNTLNITVSVISE